ncbi:uncharacterized protein LOC136767562 [Amia ocellicauda]|uniref:uncharacterized protein LOC136767562 n=1 Tax=Amia ocellicauda TaxID=2972642 RepID=UPI0034639724
MTRLPLGSLQLCLAVLLLLPGCCGGSYYYEDESPNTGTPDYENSTFDYYFYSNTSSDYEGFEMLGKNHAPTLLPPCCLVLVCLFIFRLCRSL